MFNVEFEEVTNEFRAEFDSVVHTGDVTLGEKTITQNGTYEASDDHLDGYSEVTVNVPSGAPVLQSKSVNYTPTESEQVETVEPDSAYDGLDKVEVTVDAISSSYVGSSIARKSSSDLTASGATVTAPAGYYESSASKAVASGTAGTPTATKGSVSNHSVSVTPSVTNTTGYITGSTKTGTAVTVSASELVSGTLNVTSSGTKDVTNYASASIPAGTEGTPSATKGTVSNNSVSVTPSVTNAAGFITGGTKTGTAVTVSASELVSGTKNIVANGTSDVTNYASVNVAVPSDAPTMQTKSVSFTPTTSAQSQTVTPDTGYGGLSSVGISVGAIPSQYIVPTGAKSITANGTGIDVASYATANVNVPNSYSSSDEGKVVSNGALVAQTSQTVTENGTYDTTLKNQVVVNVSGGGSGGFTITETPDSHGGTILEITGEEFELQSKSATPSETAQTITPDTGYYLESVSVGAISSSYIGSGVTRKAAATYTPSTSTQTIAAGQYLDGAQTINPIPSQYIIPSGNKAITANGTNIDVAAYSTVSVSVAGGKASQIASGVGRGSTTSYASTGISLTVAKAGTYDVYWAGYRSSTSGTNGTRLYVNGNAHSSGEQTTFNTTYANVQNVHLTNVSLSADDTIAVYARSRGTNYYMYVMNLVIMEA